MKNIVPLLLLVSCSQLALAQASEQAPKKQNVNPELRKGNQLYQEKKYKEAQQTYADALQKDPTSNTGLFNIGDAYYKNKDYNNSRKAMEASIKTTKDKKEQAKAYHNIGNSYLEEKKWEEAIQAYKQSLKLNPTDADTKYNLAYANAMLKKEGGGKDKNKKDNKDNKDKDKQNQDKKDQDKKDKDKDKKDEDKKDGDPKDQKDKGDKDQPKQQPQGQPSKLTKEQADNLLNALQQEEKKLQDKKEKGKGVPVKMDKDW